MRRFRFSWSVSLAFCTVALIRPIAAADQKSEKPKQFIYVLHLVPRLYDDKNWTKHDSAVLDRHFERFKHAIETGDLILAGRTMESGEKTFGIAIFQGADEAAARRFM